MFFDDAIRFLLFCYLGDLSNPILAAINRAYRDMQMHTVSGDLEKVIFPRRKDITQYLYDRLLHLPEYTGDFDGRHQEPIEEMKKISKKYGDLSYGLLQKWLNMSIKYMYTLKILGVDSIDDYFVKKDNIKSFHAPLDSYVLHEISMETPSWSKITSYEDYKKKERRN